ncbi:UNVERIFIED_CONTAM: hypothetical protein HDU68_005901 [Siphonaria sp. JEL0065]|nr:hypothetical protein HDU68_005901 [Siphonaria sp. JEL0065]
MGHDSDDEKPIWQRGGFQKLVIGAAVVGLGAYAVHNWREKKRHDAAAGAPAFHSYQTSFGEVIWRSVTPGTHLPQDALQLGRDADGAPLFAARAPIYGGWHIGKVNGATGQAYVSYGGKEEEVNGPFEVLCGNPKAISVVEQERDLDLDTLPHQPVDGGHEKNGDRLYVAIINYEGTTQIGKTGPQFEDGAAFGYGGKEHIAKHYKAIVLL